MRYYITLKPLEPYLFGGDLTFGKLGSEEEGTYLVASRQFPQQSAILGMLRKTLMVQNGLLTRKRRGEWVDKKSWEKANELVGNGKFDFFSPDVQHFGSIKELSPVFLTDGKRSYIKKADIDAFPYEDGRLKEYKAKDEERLRDNYVACDGSGKLRGEELFIPVEKIGNKKGGKENSLFKKTSYLLKKNFSFAFYLECDAPLSSGMVTLGADRSAFMMNVSSTEETLEYKDANGYCVLLGDTYTTLPLKEHCTFAITSEISFRSLTGKKHALKQHTFSKSKRVYLYEKGSVIIEPSESLLADMNNQNLQQIGYNTFTTKGDK